MWKKGHLVSNEIRKAVSKAQKDRKHQPQEGFQKGHKIWLGKKFSKEHKRKIALGKMGDKNPMKRAEVKAKMIQSVKGKPRYNFREEKSSNWKGGITSLRGQIYNNLEFRKWRHQIFERDNYTCCECYKIGGKLHPHHIKSFSKILKDNNIKTLKEAKNCQELWDINNGITLCIDCHKLTQSYCKNIY